MGGLVGARIITLSSVLYTEEEGVSVTTHFRLQDYKPAFLPKLDEKGMKVWRNMSFCIELHEIYASLLH